MYLNAILHAEVGLARFPKGKANSLVMIVLFKFLTPNRPCNTIKNLKTVCSHAFDNISLKVEMKTAVDTQTSPLPPCAEYTHKGEGKNC